MSTEKTIKNQAKKLLEGNWTTIITAVVVFCVALIIVQSISYAAMFAYGIFDLNTFEIKASGKLIYALISAAGYLIFFLLSPMLNGAYKTICNTAVSGSCEISDLFYFFKKGRYLKTLFVNFFVFAIFSIFCMLFNIYGYASYFLDGILKENPSFDIIINILLVLSGAVTAVLIVLAYLVLVHYQLLAYAFDDNMSAAKYCFGLYAFSFRNLGAAIKLVCGFIGWIALCFFVVPAFYVLPYLMTSMAVSAKWLFAIDRNRRLLC